MTAASMAVVTAVVTAVRTDALMADSLAVVTVATMVDYSAEQMVVRLDAVKALLMAVPMAETTDVRRAVQMAA